VPTYNRPGALVRAVKSLLDQSRRPEEVVIVDDASDRSYEEARSKLRSLSEGTDTIVRYHCMDTNGGACRARNEAARRAKGSILMFLDDDDEWEPQKIEGQLTKLYCKPKLGLVYSGRKVVEEEGNILYTIRPSSEGWLEREMLQRNLIGTTSSAAIRADVFKEVGGFDASMPALQDYDLWIRASREAPVGYDSNCTVRWRIHAQPDTQMAGKPDIYHNAFSRIYEKYELDFQELNAIDYRRAMSWRYAVLASKYAHAGSAQQYWYALKSISQYPTLSGLSKMLPLSLAQKVRGFLY